MGKPLHETFTDALHTLWTGTCVDDSLRAAELLHATACEITRIVRATGSSAGSHPDIPSCLEDAGITSTIDYCTKEE